MAIVILIGQAVQPRINSLLFIVLCLAPIQSPGRPISNLWYLVLQQRQNIDTTCKLQWLKFLFRDLGFPYPEPMTVLYDDQATIHIAEKLVFHERTKHIELDCHSILDKIQSRLIVPYSIRTSLQIADIFTKQLGQDPFHRHIGKLGVIAIILYSIILS